MRLANILKIGFVATAFVACSSDDDSPRGANLEVPETYVFERNGESTVSFGGQTTRLLQGDEILKDLLTFGTTEATIDRKFADGEGFSEATLNSDKNIRGKVAESIDYFKDANGGILTDKQTRVVEYFDSLIQSQVDTFLGAFTSKEEVPVAKEGEAGILGKRYVNAKGLEYNQAFNKGLIGALTLDQIINDYLSLTEGSTIQAANNAETLEEGKNYTQAEHFWDEAYGYLYGASDEDALSNPNTKHLDRDNIPDKFLYKYVQRVNEDADFNGIAAEIFEAFKTGRAALVAQDYERAKKEADFLRLKLSEVVGIRAVYYLQQGKDKVKDGATVDDGSAFHDLSEGFGFIYSLQFTQNPATNEPYFTAEEVAGFIAKLEKDNGFWEFTKDQSVLDELSETIAAAFEFTVAQAKSNDLAQ
ncbi:DUF4856 domain-containing protein [Aquimarina agarivorans]|uniref:DUF4856 domain-containing protein n=1 Tax=Aquimarina agarivorans TaxID=980584 RepID=UPI000248FDC6|nr:DUF4856 domain-containing protein [Aquimarina agarivorans]